MNTKIKFVNVLLCISLVMALLFAVMPTQAQEPTDPSSPKRLGLLEQAEAVSPEQARKILFAENENENLAATQIESLPTSEADITTEIQSLATALKDDPKTIFDYVHNNIEYVSTFGCMKDAATTLLVKRGNDCEQAALFIALMRAAGYEASYVVGDVTYELEVLNNWVGTEKYQAMAMFLTGGVPIDAADGKVILTRIWATAQINGQTYTFDPAMKAYRNLKGRADLKTLMGYNQTTFMADALQGATKTADFVQKMNEAKVRQDLTTYSTNLIKAMRSQYPNATLKELIGGREISPTKLSGYVTTLLNVVSVDKQQSYATLPTPYGHTFRVEYSGIAQTFQTYQISGRRVTLFHTLVATSPTNTYQPVLRVDGMAVATGTTISGDSSRNSLRITINHPYASGNGTFEDQNVTFSLKPSGNYLIMHDFGEASTAMTIRHSEQLEREISYGQSALTEPVLGETLALASYMYTEQDNRFDQLLAPLSQVVTLRHHQTGMVGQMESYYFDIAAGGGSTVSLNEAADSTTPFRVRSMMGSAFEHGIWEQLVGSNDAAISTIKAMQLGNSLGYKTYLATSLNWATVNTDLLEYDAGLLAKFNNTLSDPAQQYVLTQQGMMNLHDWNGHGYIDYYFKQMGESVDFSMSMMLGSGYGGGAGLKYCKLDCTGQPTDNCYVVPAIRQVTTSEEAEARGEVRKPTPKPTAKPKPKATATAVTNNKQNDKCKKTEKAKEEKPTKPTSGEPVDMTEGWYLYDTTDLQIGLASEPRGLSFSRSYSSQGSQNLSVLGYGWKHGYDMALTFEYDGQATFGHRHPLEAVPMLVYMVVNLDLLKENNPTIDVWLASALSTQWAMEQLTNNAVTVKTATGNYKFVKAVDGSWSAPSDIGDTLTQSETGYRLLQRDGTSYKFDLDGNFTAWQDSNGNRMTLTYLMGRLIKATDSFSRTLDFTYDVNGFLSTITDGGGRVWRYGYTDGNLTRYTDANGQVWNYEYNIQSYLTKIYPPASGGVPVVTNEYDELGRVVRQWDALGHMSEFLFGDTQSVERYPDGSELIYFFDEQRRMSGRQDQAGQLATFGYDTQGRMITVTDRLGDVTSYSYHPETHRLASLTNVKGDKTTFSYSQRASSQGEYDLTRIDYPDGTNEQFTYDARGNMTRRMDKAGQKWLYQFNEQGDMTRATNPNGGAITIDYTYPALQNQGERQTITDPDGTADTYTYDNYGRLIRLEHADKSFATYGYNLNDQLTVITDENGSVYRYEYDANGNMVKTTDAALKSVNYVYDVLDLATAITNRLGKTTRYGYDALGRMAVVTDATNMAVTFGYDTWGNVNRLTRGSKSWQFNYDAEGVLRSSSTPSGKITKMQSDKLGYLSGVTLPNGKSATTASDAMNRTTAMTDTLGQTTSFNYDPRGLLTEVSKPGVNKTAYQYDTLGSLKQITGPNGGNWVFTYTLTGRYQAKADPLGRVTTMSYDERGRVKTLTYPSGDTVTKSYDGVGNVTKVASSDGTSHSYEYDVLSRLKKATGIQLAHDDEGQVINTLADDATAWEASYDEVGRVKTVSYNNGAFNVTYSYDAASGLLKKVEDSLTQASLEFAYDADDQLASVSRSNGVKGTYSWDANGQLIGLKEGELLDLQYTLDDLGRVSSVSMVAPLYPDDFINISSSGKEARNGNSLSYDAAWQINSTGYRYDSRGRLLASPGHTYGWDSHSNVVKVDNVTLAYNGLDDLIMRTEGATKTHFYYNYALDLTPIVAEKNETSGKFARYYVWSPSGELLYMIDAANGNKVYFYHFDRLGSTLALTDDKGQVSDAYAYDPAGKLLAHQGTQMQPFTFVGRNGVRQESADGTLYHMRARYYDATTMRFLSRDPVWPNLSDPRQLDPYQYVANNPVSKSDPAGLWDLWDYIWGKGEFDENAKLNKELDGKYCVEIVKKWEKDTDTIYEPTDLDSRDTYEARRFLEGDKVKEYLQNYSNGTGTIDADKFKEKLPEELKYWILRQKQLDDTIARAKKIEAEDKAKADAKAAKDKADADAKIAKDKADAKIAKDKVDAEAEKKRLAEAKALEEQQKKEAESKKQTNDKPTQPQQKTKPIKNINGKWTNNY